MNNEVKRIPRRIKKWKKKLYGGYPTIKENIPFKPSWFILAHRITYKNKNPFKVLRRWMRRGRKS